MAAADDLVYDLVSIQYHALKGAQVYDKFLQDAQGNEECRAFIQQIQQEDAKRAEYCHHLLGQLTSTSSAYPTEGSQGISSQSLQGQSLQGQGAYSGQSLQGQPLQGQGAYSGETYPGASGSSQI